MTLQELKEQVAELSKKIKALEAKEKLESKKQHYPIYCLQPHTGLVIKFDGLKTGVVVKKAGFYEVDDYHNDWEEHTNTSVWTQLDVCKKTGFFDGQLVWCWDKDYSHTRSLKFYDAKNSYTFTVDGNRYGFCYHNYEPYEGNWPQWAQDALKTLKR